LSAGVLSVAKYVSVFDYFAAGNITSTGVLPSQYISSGVFPVADFFILLGIGIAALIGALVVFQKRELTY